MRASIAVTLITSLSPLAIAKPVPPVVDKKFDICWEKIDTIFSFGDSYSYVEGALGTKEFSWNNFTKPEGTLHDPILLNKTSANGPNWVEYLTNCFEGLPQNCHPRPFDIAFAGADIDPWHIARHRPYTISFVEQIDQWTNSVNPVVKWDPRTTLATFWIGINDLGDTKSWTNVSFSTFYNEIVDVYFDKVATLYTQKIRSFAFFNLPPIEKTPENSKKNTTAIAELVQLYNIIVDEHVKAFQAKYTDANAITIDAHAYFNSYLENEESLGFKETKTFCANYTAPDFNTNYEDYGCHAPYEYFWLNSGHPTYPVHKLLAASIAERLKEVSHC